MPSEKGPKLSHPVTREGHPIPFFPIGDRVVVQRIPPETKVGMFTIPDTHKVEQQYATVIAAGPRAQGILDDAGIQIGDTICFGKYTGTYWEWQPEGTESIRDRARVDLINVGDIFGCKELAEKMVDGRLGIGLHRPDGGGDGEYRFFEEQKQ